jgi:hypothetical protein
MASNKQNHLILFEKSYLRPKLGQAVMDGFWNSPIRSPAHFCNDCQKKKLCTGGTLKIALLSQCVRMFVKTSIGQKEHH